MLGGKEWLHLKLDSFGDFYDWAFIVFLPGLYNHRAPEYLRDIHALRLSTPMLIQKRKISKCETFF